MAISDLQGKVALITGGGRGIGQAIAFYFAEKGIKVSICGRKKEFLERTCQALRKKGKAAIFVQADVTDDDAMEAAIHKTKQSFGSIDVLINNAGILKTGKLKSLSLEDVRAMMEVNFYGTVRTTLKVLPFMQARGFGRIVNIASIGSRRVFPGYGGYAATKFAVAAFTEALRTELAGTNIKVSMVHPGGVDTDMGAPLKKKRWVKFSMVKPEHVARAAYRAASTGKPEIYVPGPQKMMVLLNQLSPGTVDALARLLMKD